MGYPDPQRPGEHPGGQNYPPGQQGGNVPRPTRGYERPEPPTERYDGGYQLGYAQGAHGDQYAQYGGLPPQGPLGGPGGPSGPGDGSGGGGNRKLLWIALTAVVFALVLAVIVALVATSGGPSNTASEGTTTTQPTTTTSSRPSGITLPSGVPSGISIPPILGGGSTTGPNARKWRVEVTGTGTAQLVTVGVPDTDLFGTQPLPWSKEFTSDAILVTVTVLGYTGDVGCTITRDGATIARQNSADGSGGPLICTAGR